MNSQVPHRDTDLDRLTVLAARLPDAPPALVRAAVALWATRPAASGLRARIENVRRQLVAALSFDSAASSGLALGMRGAAASARHLFFSAPGHDIDLRVSASAGRFDLSGQSLGADDPGQILLVSALDAGGTGGTAELNDLGEFRLRGLSRGRYRLTLRGTRDDIVLPEIDIGPIQPRA